MLQLSDLEAAEQVVNHSELQVRQTPCIQVAGRHGKYLFSSSLDQVLPAETEVFLKLENWQNQGSFKLRGIANQIENVLDNNKDDVNACSPSSLVTLSAGNYGRAFAYAMAKKGLKGTVLMPENAPKNRSELIASMGASVEVMASADLMTGVARHQDEFGAKFMHPIDDLSLIAGYGTVGTEILAQVPDVDMILVCCGGGGLLAGIAKAVELKATKAVTVMGVEPEAANGMYLSLQRGEPVPTPDKQSIASGLSPPFVGRNAFQIVRQSCQGIALVSEDELRDTVKLCYDHGIVAEAAGVAALAGLRHGKVAGVLGGRDQLAGKKIVVVVTGGNISAQEMLDTFTHFS